jgi:hypothetical protein
MPVSAPAAILDRWMAPFAAFFTRLTFQHVLTLVAGALLAPGRRTVAAALSVMGLRDIPTFTSFHRVLNRARWAPHALAEHLLRLLVAAFVPDGPVVIGLDETLERRWGPDPGQGHLSRPGALLERPLCQGLGPALGLCHAAGADPLGRPGLGLAVPDRAPSQERK